MTLVRLNPTRSFFPSVGSIDHLLSNFMDDSQTYTSEWLPVVDLAESKDEYQLIAEIPGMKKDEIKVSLKDNILTISGEKKVEKKEDSDTIFRSERKFGKFERAFKLAEEVKPDGIKASYKEGILTVSIPKDIEKSLPKMISIS